MFNMLPVYRLAMPLGMMVVAMMATSCSSSGYKKYADDPDRQVAAIIRENGCLACHSVDAPMPFYASFPIVGPVVVADIQDGTRYIDFGPMVEALENGQPVAQVDLAKLEHTALSGSMPPQKYKVMHWGTSLDKEERAAILNWAKSVRKANFTTPTVDDRFLNEPVQPLMTSLQTNPEKVALGFDLYHDTRLSGDNTISCASCHGLETGGVDRKQYSEGINGQFGGVNAPTVFNAALNAVQFWDGRAADLQAQAAGPPLNPVEMGSASFDEIAGKLAADPVMNERFLAIYPDGINEQSITDAIAEFEKTLLTPGRFDQYLMGDESALTPEELAGYEVFKENKCATCHVGVNFGGQSFEYMGIKGNYFEARKSGLTDGDLGRFAQTQNEQDKHKFKTPTLRNVMLTAPYMHDGSVASINEAVQIMNQFQTGQQLNAAEMENLLAFLHTLTGEYNGQLLQ